MIYHINSSGDIIAASKENANGKIQQFGAGVRNISHVELDNPQNYRWNGVDFVERDNVPYTLPAEKIAVDEQIEIAIPKGAGVIVTGPGLYHSEVSQNAKIEFQSERLGVYTFSLSRYPFKQTEFTVEVIL